MSSDSNFPKPDRGDYERALQSMGTFIDVEVDDLMILADRANSFASERATRSLEVSRIMRSPVSVVRPDTTMSEAAHILVTERISGLPVVDESGRVTGLITEADFLRCLGVPAHHPTQSLWQTLEGLFGDLAPQRQMCDPTEQVASHMVRDVVCASPSDDINDVIALMKCHRIKRVVVCNEAHHVLGMITRSDLVRIFFDRYLLLDGRFE
jgi:CBS-domain-containing membrane protein